MNNSTRMSTTLRARSDTGAVFVTGGTGFLGGAIVRRLGQGGQRPTVFRRAGADCSLIRGIPIAEVVGDLEDSAPLEAAIHAGDTVIHCAAVTDMAARSDETLERINVHATARVAACCRRVGARRLVYVSSSGTMGPTGDATDETAPFRTPQNRYFASKYRAEQAVLEECRRGLDAVIVNPTAMIGAVGLSQNQQRLIRQATRSAVCLALPGGASFVSVDDVAQGILKVVERGRTGERYILGGVNLSFQAYARLVASIAGRAPHIVRLPAPLFRAAAALTRFAGPRVATLRDPSAVSWLSCHAFYSSRKAVEQLGYRITPMAEVLPAVIAVYG